MKNAGIAQWSTSSLCDCTPEKRSENIVGYYVKTRVAVAREAAAVAGGETVVESSFFVQTSPSNVNSTFPQLHQHGVPIRFYAIEASSEGSSRVSRVKDPLKLDVVISFPDHGFHLRFDPWSQVI